jgi:hypothetical protein
VLLFREAPATARAWSPEAEHVEPNASAA